MKMINATMKQKLIEELASKMAINDLMYDYRMRCITEFAQELERLFVIPDNSNAEHTVCPECGDYGWIYDEAGIIKSTCPCHY